MLKGELVEAENRALLHGRILDEGPGSLDETAVVGAKKSHPQAFVEIKIIKILMKYVKNQNSCKIDNFVYN